MSGTRKKPDLSSIKNTEVVKEEIKEVVPEEIKIEVSPEDRQKINRLELSLKMYKNEFPKELADFSIKKGLSLEELIELRQSFDLHISTKSMLNGAQAGILGGIRALEMGLLMFTPVQCKGMSDMLSKDEACLSDIKHLSLKYMADIKIEPEVRLAMKVLSTAMLLHQINESGVLVPKEGEKMIKKQPISYDNIDQANDAFTDL